MQATWIDRGALSTQVGPALLALLTCASLAAQAPPFVVTPDNGVVLEQSARPDIRLVCSRTFPVGLSGFWRPTASQLRPLEAALPGFLASHISEHWRPRTGAVSIYRQYVGMYRAGRPVIYVNGVQGERQNWRTETIVVCDGGPTNFGAVFDVQQGRFTEFIGNS